MPPTIILVAIVTITLAMLIYTAAVFMNWRSGRFTKVHMILFVLGLISDVVGTTMMAASVDFAITLSLHSVSGYTALVLMIIVNLAGGFALARSNEWLLDNFWRFSIPVWVVWMGSWITGWVVGLEKL